MRVDRINEGYAWVPEKRDFAEEPRREILGNKIYLVYEAS